MKLLVITSAPLIGSTLRWEAYAPYVQEMNSWRKYVDQIQFCCPIWETDNGLLTNEITFKIDKVIELNDFTIKNRNNIIKSMVRVFQNLIIISKAMQRADHIHVRCPGNMGLLGAIVQVLFPKKPKTAKYAGNWDPKSKQPWSYRLQKWILSNTWLTKNMQVLVYGDWPHQSKNIKPFFTATYSESEMQLASSLPLKDQMMRHSELPKDSVLQFLFVGTLTPNKRPLLCAEVVQELHQKGYQVQLTYFGEGPERHAIENYILDYNLQQEVILKGNVSKEELKVAYQNHDFLLFFSQSEGWPKAVAEAMFWGCVPITTAVSCVPYMLGNGTRGTLVKPDKTEIVSAIASYLTNPEKYKVQSQQAVNWSRQFTLEKLEEEIVKLLEA